MFGKNPEEKKLQKIDEAVGEEHARWARFFKSIEIEADASVPVPVVKFTDESDRGVRERSTSFTAKENKS